MRESNLKRKILVEEAEQITSNKVGILFLTIEGVTRYTNGFLTPLILKEMRSKKEGPAYLKRGKSISYLKEEIDRYLAGLKVVPDAMEMLQYLEQPDQIAQLKKEIAELRAELMIIKLMASKPSGDLPKQSGPV
jgi:uncharacterized small protein (DUF1192 family)